MRKGRSALVWLTRIPSRRILSPKMSPENMMRYEDLVFSRMVMQQTIRFRHRDDLHTSAFQSLPHDLELHECILIRLTSHQFELCPLGLNKHHFSTTLGKDHLTNFYNLHGIQESKVRTHPQCSHRNLKQFLPNLSIL